MKQTITEAGKKPVSLCSGSFPQNAMQSLLNHKPPLTTSLSRPPHLQAKLKIGDPGDQYEQEADQVAEQVMRMPEPVMQQSPQTKKRGETALRRTLEPDPRAKVAAQNAYNLKQQIDPGIWFDDWDDDERDNDLDGLIDNPVENGADGIHIPCLEQGKAKCQSGIYEAITCSGNEKMRTDDPSCNRKQSHRVLYRVCIDIPQMAYHAAGLTSFPNIRDVGEVKRRLIADRNWKVFYLNHDKDRRDGDFVANSQHSGIVCQGQVIHLAGQTSRRRFYGSALPSRLSDIEMTPDLWHGSTGFRARPSKASHTQVRLGVEASEEEILQTKSAGNSGSSHLLDRPLIKSVLSSPGRPLDAVTRSFMEPRFGQDFSRVRVHADEKAANSARAVNARAYTVGQNIVFGAGQYAPGHREGQRLLAHELVHVGQQAKKINIPSPVLQRSEMPTTFNDFLREGAKLFFTKKDTGLGFGMTARSGNYDTSRWKKINVTTIQATVLPSVAMDNLVSDVKSERKIDGMPLWTVDCLEFSQLIRVYAYWRTMKSNEFDRKFNPLELGAQPTMFESTGDLRSPFGWMVGREFGAGRPHEALKVINTNAPPSVNGRSTQQNEYFIQNHSWDELLNVAPVGTLIQWENRALNSPCKSSPNRQDLNCNWNAEWTTKVGDDLYAAWNSGILNENQVKQQMAAYGLRKRSITEVSREFIEQNIYIKQMRFPEQFGSLEFFNLTSAIDVMGAWKEHLERDSKTQ